MSLTILLADDHQIVRQGLRAILETVKGFDLLGEAADGPDTLRLVEELQPNVLVLDLMMPGINGLEVARRVHRSAPETHIVVLSMHSNEAYILEALRAGASAYVLKEAESNELIKAIRAVARGERYFSSPITEEAIAAYEKKAAATSADPFLSLTTREREVLQWTVEGHTGFEVSERLFISPRTVESHRANLMRKLGVRNQRELVRLAIERGMVQLIK